MADYNAPGSDKFVFLLSTRAGGAHRFILHPVPFAQAFRSRLTSVVLGTFRVGDQPGHGRHGHPLRLGLEPAGGPTSAGSRAPHRSDASRDGLPDAGEPEPRRSDKHTPGLEPKHAVLYRKHAFYITARMSSSSLKRNRALRLRWSRPSRRRSSSAPSASSTSIAC